MWKFLTEYFSHFGRLEQTCQLIGAARTIDYLHAIKKCFPGEAIPEDEDARADLCNELELELRKIDRKYLDVNSEAVDCLRKYINANKREFTRQVSGFWSKYS